MISVLTSFREWLELRPWISGHFHVKVPRRLFASERRRRWRQRRRRDRRRRESLASLHEVPS